jgi:hypothetical protein
LLAAARAGRGRVLADPVGDAFDAVVQGELAAAGDVEVLVADVPLDADAVRLVGHRLPQHDRRRPAVDDDLHLRHQLRERRGRLLVLPVDRLDGEPVGAVLLREKGFELRAARRGAVVPLPVLALVGRVEQVDLFDLGEPVLRERDDDRRLIGEVGLGAARDLGEQRVGRRRDRENDGAQVTAPLGKPWSGRTVRAAVS